MSFPAEHYIEKMQERAIIGTQKDAAVNCSFTANGRTIPRICRIEGEEGEIITIDNIRIIKVEHKLYAGIPATKHWCEAEHNGIMKQFYLVFYPNDSKWKLIF